MSGQQPPPPPRFGGGQQQRQQYRQPTQQQHAESQYNYNNQPVMPQSHQQQSLQPSSGNKGGSGGGGSGGGGVGRGHPRNLASVGDATALFGQGQSSHQSSTGPSGGYQDFINSIGQQDQQHLPQTPGGTRIGTVFEEDEPESSPELGRRHYSQFPDVSQQQQYDQTGYGHEYQGYYDQQTQPQSTQATAYDDYSTQDWAAAADSYASDAIDGEQAPTAQGDYFEPPFYPGFRYDPVTNTYVEDPSTSGTDAHGGEENVDQSNWESSQAGVVAGEQVDDGQLGGQGEYQYEGQPQQSYAEYDTQDYRDGGDQDQDQEQEGQSYAGTWDHSAPPVSQEASTEAGSFNIQQGAMNNESWDYNEDEDPYADQPDPYAAAVDDSAIAPAVATTADSATAQVAAQGQSHEDYYSQQQQYDQSSYNAAAPDSYDSYAPNGGYDQQQYDQSQSQDASGQAYDWNSQPQQDQYGTQDAYAEQRGYDQQQYGTSELVAE